MRGAAQGIRSGRPLAASALFRLAGIRRQQNQTQQAVARYQRLLLEFPDFNKEAVLARKQLAGLGVAPELQLKAPATPAANDEDLANLAILKATMATSPDLLKKPDRLHEAIKENFVESVTYLVKQAGNEGNGGSLITAWR